MSAGVPASRPATVLSGRGRIVLFAVAAACVSAALKLPIVAYGLPAEFNADEATILKDPFRLAYLYAHGQFPQSTNLFLWVLQVWYGVLYIGGRLFGAWGALGQFRESIAAESPGVVLWGRLFGVLASACAVYILAVLVARRVPRWPERLLILGTLAVNPVDLVASPWLKYDGAAALVNAILVAAFVRYLDSNERRDRRWLYFLALAAVSFRIDFIVYPIVVILHDAVARRPWRDVAAAAAAGIVTYAVVTLRPVAMVYQVVTAGGANPELNVETPFEGHILERLLADIASGALSASVVSAIGFYGALSAALGVPLLVICAGSIARDTRARWLLMVVAVALGPLLLSSAQSTRYWLSPSVCLLLAAGLAVGADLPKRLQLAVLSAVFLVCASLTVETLVHLRTQLDSRVRAGEYLIGRSTRADIIMVEGYLNPGYHAEISECPDELRRKAVATQEARVGTGETFLQWARRAEGVECRRILEVANRDRFAGSSYAGRWINTYDVASLEAMAPLPTFFTTAAAYERFAGPNRPAFIDWVDRRYGLAGVFEPEYREPRLRWLLTSTPYHARLLVYERKP
jgi:hypothetical protein